MKKITVYLPTYNYGRYIARAIDSVLHQTMDEWELIVIDDGSTDNTQEVLRAYRDVPKVRIVEQRNRGLSVSNNIAIRLSNGRYIMRLDADDFLDENALLVMSHVLDTRPEIGLVYPDYYVVDDAGEMIELVRRKKIDVEVDLLDLPAHGACTMIRRECLVELGGYDETITCQDGYELWLRFIESFKPANVNVPLFYYRQHEGSLTTDQRHILETRSRIKQNFVKNYRSQDAPRVVGIIPVMARSENCPDAPFVDLNGQPLIWHTLTQAMASTAFDRIVLTSNDPGVLEYGQQFSGVTVMSRPDHLASSVRAITDTVAYVLEMDAKEGRPAPDAAMVLYTNAPLRRAKHITTAIDALRIFNVDSVVSVTEELSYCYRHGSGGLEPIEKNRELRLEKKAIYKETGAILLAKTSAIDARFFVGGRIGHIVMLPEESVRIKTDFDLWLTRNILGGWLGQSEASRAFDAGAERTLLT